MNDRADSRRGSQTRIERLVAAGRVALAAFSFLGVWLDPSEPTNYRTETYAILAIYLAYAFVLGLIVWAVRTVPRRLPAVTHAFDLAVFIAFMYLTSGPNSPFFAYFTFATVAGTLRWHWRGAVATAGLSLAAFLCVGWFTARVAADPQFELNRFIIRAVYLVVVAVLLAYLGAAVERGRLEITRLATWPDRAFEDEQSLIDGILAHAANTVGAPRVLLMWEETDEPWAHFALRSGDVIERWREAPGVAPVVTEQLNESDFLCIDAAARQPVVLFQTPSGGFGDWVGPPIDQRVVSRVRMRAVVCVRLMGRSITGRVFLLDTQRATSDTVALAQVVSQQIATALDHFVLGRRSRSAALLGERVRMSQDIHDGVLQSLTGVGLRLHALDTTVASDPAGARTEVQALRSLVMDEQRNLRLLVSELSDSGVAQQDQPSSLAARIDALADRLERVWRVRVDRDLADADREYPVTFMAAACRIVHESVVNAVRHGRATIVRVTASAGADSMFLTVADNGCGFSFHGRYDHVMLSQGRMGPLTVKERVSALGGSLVVDSGSAGATLEISVPLPPEVA